MGKSYQEQLKGAFTEHEPKGDQLERYNELRDATRALAERYVHICPSSRELSLAITHLEQAYYWSKEAIARNE
jgi:hypothetical protein